MEPRRTTQRVQPPFSDDLMQGNPAVPGGSLKSKPTWLSTFGCLATSALFWLGAARGHRDPRDDPVDKSDGLELKLHGNNEEARNPKGRWSALLEQRRTGNHHAI